MTPAGQTTIESCAICGELAEKCVEIEPARLDSKRRFIDKRVRWLCGRHLDARERSLSEARRLRAARAVRGKRLKAIREIGALFDGDAGAPVGTGRRDD